MAGMARSALYQGEPCRAATDKPLVCGTTEHKYLQAFIFYFVGQVSFTNTCAYACYHYCLRMF